MAKKQKKKYTSIGGQALMEGIMMRGPELTTMALRRLDGSIYTETTRNAKPSIWNKIPFVRGVVNFVQSMTSGSKTLMRSADIAIEDEERMEREQKEKEKLALQANAEQTAAAEAEVSEPVKPTETAETEIPETEIPETEIPETEIPETEIPETEISEIEISEIAEVTVTADADAAAEAAETAEASEPVEAPAENEALPEQAEISDELSAEAEQQEPVDLLSLIPSVKSSKPVEFADEEKKSKPQKKADSKKKDSGMEGFTFLSVVLGIGLAALLFIFLPTWCYTGIMKIPGAAELLAGNVWKSVIEGVIKLAVFIAYILLCTTMKEIRRVFEYHGAEHKTIFCYEAGEELTVENVKKYKRFHPRCGTSFIILTVLIGVISGICISAFLPQYDNVWLRPLIKIAILPVVMGVGYELLKLCGRFDNIFTRIIRAPGLWVQRITTREPDDGQIECAIAALKPVIPENGEDMA